MKLISRDEALSKGLKRFYTGVPCKHNHVCERKVNRSTCVECERIQKNNYKANNKEAHKALKKRHYEKHKDKIQTKIREYAVINEDAIKEYQANYYIENKDTILAGAKKRSIEKSDEIKEYKLRYCKENKEKLREDHRAYRQTENGKLVKRISSQKRYALKKSTEDGSVTKEAITNMMESQEYKCVLCSTSIKDKYHVDHIKPLAKEGEHTISNIQLLCPHCNISKSDKYE
jgi:5-methylcytosine-specific restriction endonuclease McrA